MKNLLGDYEAFIDNANSLIDASGIPRKELLFCDTLCYRVETNERYDELKSQLQGLSNDSHEAVVNNRLIIVFSLKEPLHIPGWQRPVPYIELPQPKPDNQYREGLDHAQFVTMRGLSEFRSRYASVKFDEKGLSHILNPLVKIANTSVAIKFHDKHMGSVVELERTVVVQRK